MTVAKDTKPWLPLVVAALTGIASGFGSNKIPGWRYDAYTGSQAEARTEFIDYRLKSHEMRLTKHEGRFEKLEGRKLPPQRLLDRIAHLEREIAILKSRLDTQGP